MDYATLFKTVQAYVENDFPDTEGTGSLTSTEQINTFITQAEQRIYNTAQLLPLRKNVTGNATANNPYLSLPSDWLANFSVAVIDPVTADYSFLLPKDVNYIREAFPNPADVGSPTHYASFDENTLILGPTPDFPYDVELHYFYYPQSIVTVAGGHTWLGDNFDAGLVYGALLEAYTFMKGEADVMANYQKRYDDAMIMLKMHAEGKQRQDTYRTPQVRYPVK